MVSNRWAPPVALGGSSCCTKTRMRWARALVRRRSDRVPPCMRPLPEGEERRGQDVPPRYGNGPPTRTISWKRLRKSAECETIRAEGRGPRRNRERPTAIRRTIELARDYKRNSIARWSHIARTPILCQICSKRRRDLEPPVVSSSCTVHRTQVSSLHRCSDHAVWAPSR
jgi:hypothetical protein